jgi:hypothetical protein
VSGASAPGTAGSVSTFITDILNNECDFVAPGRITTNTLQVLRQYLPYRRCWDVIRELVQAGGSTFKPWRFYVEADGYAAYELVNLNPVFEWRGRDHGLQGPIGRQSPWQVYPGVFRNQLRLPSAPPTETFLTDGRDFLVAEVEMAQGQEFPTLKTHGVNEEDILTRQHRLARQIQLEEERLEREREGGG